MKRSKLEARANGRWQPLKRSSIIQKTPEQIEELVSGIRSQYPQYSEEHVRNLIHQAHSEVREIWKNDQYTVQVIRWPPMNINNGDVGIIQLSIRRDDRAPSRDWRHFQRIKNEIVGPECEAIELYPAESRLVDTANQYHLWCIDDPTFRFPFGYHEGRLTGDIGAGGAIQRPHDKEDECDQC